MPLGQSLGPDQTQLAAVANLNEAALPAPFSLVTMTSVEVLP